MAIDKLELFGFKPQTEHLGNGHAVQIRRLSALDKIGFTDYLAESKEGEKDLSELLDLNAFLLQKCLLDDEGKNLFVSAEEVKQIVDLSDIWKLGSIALKINGLAKETEDDIKKKSQLDPEPTNS